MSHFSLLVKFTVAGDNQVHVKGAARIKVDGRGGLTLYDALNCECASVCLGRLQSLTIQAFPWTQSYQPAAAIH